MIPGINPIPAGNPLDKDGAWVPTWQAFFSSVHNFLGPVGNSGTTAQRPTDSSFNPLYLGQTYFDTSLNLPIWVKSRNPTVWINASGTPV